VDVIPVSDVPDVLADARRFYEADDLASAEQLCRRVLRDHPSHPDALHRLGRIAHARWPNPPRRRTAQASCGSQA